MLKSLSQYKNAFFLKNNKTVLNVTNNYDFCYTAVCDLKSLLYCIDESLQITILGK